MTWFHDNATPMTAGPPSGPCKFQSAASAALRLPRDLLIIAICANLCNLWTNPSRIPAKDKTHDPQIPPIVTDADQHPHSVMAWFPDCATPMTAGPTSGPCKFQSAASAALRLPRDLLIIAICANLCNLWTNPSRIPAKDKTHDPQIPPIVTNADQHPHSVMAWFPDCATPMTAGPTSGFCKFQSAASAARVQSKGTHSSHGTARNYTEEDKRPTAMMNAPAEVILPRTGRTPPRHHDPHSRQATMIPANVGQAFLSAAGCRSCLHFWILDSDFWILCPPSFPLRAPLCPPWCNAPALRLMRTCSGKRLLVSGG